MRGTVPIPSSYLMGSPSCLSFTHLPYNMAAALILVLIRLVFYWVLRHVASRCRLYYMKFCTSTTSNSSSDAAAAATATADDEYRSSTTTHQAAGTTLPGACSSMASSHFCSSSIISSHEWTDNQMNQEYYSQLDYDDDDDDDDATTTNYEDDLAAGAGRLQYLEISCKTCAVCLNELRDSDKQVRELRNCCHVFHSKCIRRWLDHNDQKTCPLCRTPLSSSSSLLISMPPIISSRSSCCSGALMTTPTSKSELSWAVERLLYLFGDDLL